MEVSEILKIELSELLQTVRLKRQNGTVLEASDINAVRDCCSEIRNTNKDAGQALLDFFNLAENIRQDWFPVRVEFAVKTGD